MAIIGLAGCEEESKPVSAAIDFHRDVEPIFRAKCSHCHGSMQQLGGLRLDMRAPALAGGLSGKMLISQPSEESELLRRVLSDDPAIAMPKEGGKLAAEQVEILRNWVEAGAPWPDLEPPSGLSEFRERYGLDLQKRLSVVGGEPKVYVLFLITLVMLFMERIRRVPLDGHWSLGWRRRVANRCRQWHASRTWLLILGLLSCDVVQFSMRQSALLARQEIELYKRSVGATPLTGSLSGLRPTPLSPRNAPPFGGTYFRGNDERNEKLFNGGYYRTATMRLALHDDADKPVELGQLLGGSTLFVRLEIERAAKATPSLFTEQTMSQVLLTRRASDQKDPFPADVPVRLEVLTPEERWVAKYQIGEFEGQPETALNGIVYVYANGQLGGESVVGTIHFGIVYALRIREHIVKNNSELWMGPVVVPGNFQYPDPQKISLPEWFDTNPIPEITGEPSTDPKLLGIPEHLDKGV